MPRKPRIEFEGAVYHVMARGNRGEAIFIDREDSLKFLDIFGTVCGDFNWECYAWCLMPNHYHILIRTQDANLSKGMQRLNSAYAQFANWKRDLGGHLLQGRYKAIVVEEDAYLLELVRYIALNPVRAGLAEQPAQWRWGSHRQVMEASQPSSSQATTGGGREPAPSWLRSDKVLELLASDPVEARAALEKFVAKGIAADKIADQIENKAFETLLGQNAVLGSKAFCAKVAERAGVAGEVSSTQPQSLATFREQWSPRDKAMAAAFWIGGYRQTDISRAFGAHPSTVSRAKSRYQSEFA